MTIAELIEKLEVATKPSRELDALVECELRRLQAYEVGLSDSLRAHWRLIGARGEVIDGQELTRYHVPEYSSLVDAALTLIPRGHRWYVADGDYSSSDRPVASVYQTDQLLQSGSLPRSVGATPAIALCIAALKARAQPWQ